MKKYITYVLLCATLLSLTGCGSNSMKEQEKTDTGAFVENNDTGTETDSGSTETDSVSDYEMKGPDVVYNLGDFPESFWSGYDYGVEAAGITNREIFEKRLEESIGWREGKLVPPDTEYTVYADDNRTDDTAYELEIHTDGWLYLPNIRYMDQTVETLDIKYLKNDLTFQQFRIEMETNRDYPADLKILDTINGWTVAETDSGVDLYCKTDESGRCYFVIELKNVLNNDDMFKTLYTSVAEHITYKGKTKELPVVSTNERDGRVHYLTHIDFSDSYKVVDLGDVLLDFSNHYIMNWDSEHAVIFVHKDSDLTHEDEDVIIEKEKGLKIEEVLAGYGENYYLIKKDYHYKGLDLCLVYEKETITGETDSFANGNLTNVIFESGGHVYVITLSVHKDEVVNSETELLDILERLPIKTEMQRE